MSHNLHSNAVSFFGAIIMPACRMDERRSTACGTRHLSYAPGAVSHGDISLAALTWHKTDNCRVCVNSVTGCCSHAGTTRLLKKNAASLHRKKSVFTSHNNQLVNTLKQPVCYTPMLNHSLAASVDRADQQKFISGQAKRGSGSLSDRNGRTVCRDL